MPRSLFSQGLLIHATKTACKGREKRVVEGKGVGGLDDLVCSQRTAPVAGQDGAEHMWGAEGTQWKAHRLMTATEQKQ